MHSFLSITPFTFLAICWVMFFSGPFKFGWWRGCICKSLSVIIKVSIFPLFHAVVSELVLPWYFVTCVIKDTGKVGVLFLSLQHLWLVQMGTGWPECRIHLFAHYIFIIIIIQTYVFQVYSVTSVAKVMYVLSILICAVNGAECFQFTKFLITGRISALQFLCIIKSDVWIIS